MQPGEAERSTVSQLRRRARVEIEDLVLTGGREHLGPAEGVRGLEEEGSQEHQAADEHREGLTARES